MHVVGLRAHLGVVAECLELGLGHAERLEQQRIGVDMHGLHVGEGGHHHLHGERLEDRNVTLEIVVADLDVRLGEEAEDLGQQIALIGCDTIRRPVLEVGAERHLLAHPVGLLLPLPQLIGPGVAVDVVGAGRLEQADAALADQRLRIDGREIDH